MSGNIDERGIRRLLDGGAPIDGFGVGTKLDTSEDAPYLECAYKLVEYAGKPRLKTSTGKATLPGRKQVFRRMNGGVIAGDTITLEEERPEGEPLLRKVMEKGRRLETAPDLAAISPLCRRATADAAGEPAPAGDESALRRPDLTGPGAPAGSDTEIARLKGLDRVRRGTRRRHRRKAHRGAKSGKGDPAQDANPPIPHHPDGPLDIPRRHIDTAARVEQNGHLKPHREGIEGAEADAVIRRQPAEVDTRNPHPLQVVVEAGRGLLVVLNKGGIGVDQGIIALADDQIDRTQVKIPVKIRPEGAGDAVIGPQDLFETVEGDDLVGPLSVRRGEGDMPGRVPILGGHAFIESGRDGVDDRDDPVPFRHGQRAAGAKIVLDIRDDEDSFFISSSRSRPIRSSRRFALHLGRIMSNEWGAPGRNQPWIRFRSQAMFRPRVFIVSIPSASFSTSPGSRPIPIFQ